MKELILNGHVYIGTPPLYLVKKGQMSEYVYDDKALPAAVKRMGKGYAIQRYKGLGEMNPEQLWDTTMNPAHRTLVQVTLEDAAMAERMVTILMGDKVEPRRVYISEHADFNKEDHFRRVGDGLIWRAKKKGRYHRAQRDYPAKSRWRTSCATA